MEADNPCGKVLFANGADITACGRDDWFCSRCVGQMREQGVAVATESIALAVEIAALRERVKELEAELMEADRPKVGNTLFALQQATERAEAAEAARDEVETDCLVCTDRPYKELREYNLKLRAVVEAAKKVVRVSKFMDVSEKNAAMVYLKDTLNTLKGGE